MPFRYSSEFRRRSCERMLAGESVKDLAAELSVDSSTLYKWRRKALIDSGRSVGLKSHADCCGVRITYVAVAIQYWTE